MKLAYKLAAVATLAMSFTGIASAQTNWDATHPRRAEVNQRLANQDHRIHQEVREGDMSHREAARLHRDDHQAPRGHQTSPRTHMLRIGECHL